jgi:hypothetical protein
MSREYHTLRRNGQVIEQSRRGNWSPGQPFDPTLRPDPDRALARHAFLWDGARRTRKAVQA